jgi:hypothetical protein
MIGELRNLRMIWVKQRVWRRIYMIGLARRAGELGAGYKLLIELGTDLEVSVALVWGELIHESVVVIETCTTSMHPSSIFQSSIFRLQESESKNKPTDLR